MLLPSNPPPPPIQCSLCEVIYPDQSIMFRQQVASWYRDMPTSMMDICPRCEGNGFYCPDCNVFYPAGRNETLPDDCTVPRCIRYRREYSDDFEEHPDDEYDDTEPPACPCWLCVQNRRSAEHPFAAEIHSYNYRPQPIFKGEDPFGLYLGAELEVDSGSGDKWSLAETACNTLGSIAYLKEDGSISDGFEIVTHPMTYSWAMEKFPWELLPALREEGARVTSGTGLHIHVSKAGFGREVTRNKVNVRVGTDSHQYRWLKFVYRCQDEFTQLARRNPEEWGAFHPSMRQSAIHHVKGATIETPSRYSAINVLNLNTFEIRIFRSTLNPIKMQAALGLVQASIEYTRDLSAAQIVRDRRTWGWDGFTGWVADHRGQYGPLISQIRERIGVNL